MAASVHEFFNQLEHRIDPGKTAGINAVYQFDITGQDGGLWHVALADGNATVNQGAAADPDIVLTASSADWLDIVSGKLNGQTAFLTGKLKLKGDMTLAMKLQAILG